jgi:TonB family protein
MIKINRSLLLFCLLISFINTHAQEHKKDSLNGTIIIDYAPSPPPPDSIKVYTHLDTMPKFRGDINKYFRDSIKYPQEAIEKKIQGKVYVAFIVEKDGSISNVQIVRSDYPALTNEATRVVSAMPKWIPGKQNGKTVRIQYVVPIHFNLPPASGGTMKK